MKKNNKLFKLLLILFMIFVATGCSMSTDLDFGSKCVQCGDEIYFPYYLVYLCANIFNFLKIMIPVILIIVGMIELFKAVIASDEKKMAAAKDSLIKKFIAAIMVFLVFAIIQFAFTVVPSLLSLDIDVFDCVEKFVGDADSLGDGVPCPSRINGNSQDMKDKDEPIDMPTTGGSDSGDRTSDSDKDYSCWYCGNNDYRWAVSASSNYCTKANKSEADCRKAMNNDKTEVCYECDSGQKYRVGTSNPNPGHCFQSSKDVNNCYETSNS